MKIKGFEGGLRICMGVTPIRQKKTEAPNTLLEKVSEIKASSHKKAPKALELFSFLSAYFQISTKLVR